MAAMVVAQGHDRIGRHLGGGKIVQRIRSIAPARPRYRKDAVLHHQGLITLVGEVRDMAKLLGIADDHRPLGAVEKRYRRRNVALARLVDDH